MRLSDYVSERFVVLGVEARDVDGALAAIAGAASEAGLGAAPQILGALQARERLHPTGLGAGLAVPHAVVAGLERPVVGVARVTGGALPWGGAGEEGVRFVFTILSPPGREQEHVGILASICRLARHEEFAEAVERAASGREVVNAIERMEAGRR